MAQESTFVADIRSRGQRLRPDAAAAARPRRQYARKLQAAVLVAAADRSRRRTSGWAPRTSPTRSASSATLHLVLASYNAGERAVPAGWPSGPASTRDEFIDDIPYPETQNYVKKILGTAEDYRRLYGSDTRVDGRRRRRQPPWLPAAIRRRRRSAGSRRPRRSPSRSGERSRLAEQKPHREEAAAAGSRTRTIACPSSPDRRRRRSSPSRSSAR